MSIFKSTFKPYVIRQINTRQNLLSEVKRPVEFAHYVSSKSPWIRMTSFVDYQGSPDLAKKYILMGGSLYNMKSGGYSQRRGIGGAGAAYDGDISSTQYGIRPMPGIAELNTRSLGAYGSLTEATVKFYAWDVKQLEDLTVLYLRPGYKVLLEWGWSMYLDTSIDGEDYKKKTDPNSLKSSFTKYSIQTMPFNTIDCFNPNITQDSIYDQLDKIRHRYSGNYDGVLGSIKNYQYTLLPNGAYECTVTLISIGDVIDTIRLNDTLGYEASEGVVDPATETPTTGSVNPDIKSDFEIIFDEYAKIGGYNDRSKSDIIKSIDSLIQPKDSNYIDPYVYKYQIPGDLGLVQQIFPHGIEKQGSKRTYSYLQFGYVLHILNSLKNVFASKNQTLFEIEIPSDPDNLNSLSNGLCQASYNVVSIDPSVCLIRNSSATLFTSKEAESDGSVNTVDVKGFRPNIYRSDPNPKVSVRPPVSIPPPPSNNIREYLYLNTNFGLIGNIYVNILEIVSIYKEQAVSNNGYVYLGEFISALLSKMSYSLGSINDFGKFVSNNKVVIIDTHYTEVGADSAYANKFKINIAGNNSIVRDHKIESKIFPSQASMIAIAAQSRENISSLQTSTYNYINEKLSDRLLGEKTNKREDQAVEEEKAKEAKLNSILKLIQYVNQYVIPNQVSSDSYVSNVSTMNGYLNTLLVEMEGGTNYKAVIPVSVNLTIDGLSGLTIGEIFTVDKKVLPKDHKDKSIGFIITKLSSQITAGSWTTNIESQMCVLDQESKQIRTKKQAEDLLGQLLNLAERNKLKNISSIVYFNILAALTADVLSGRIQVKNEYGDLVVRDESKVLYTRTALKEFVPGGKITLEDVIQDLNRSYLRSYPNAKKRNFYDKFFYRDDNLDDAQVASDIIRGMYYYNYMVDEIKSKFDAEFDRIMARYVQGKVSTETKTRDGKGQVSTSIVFDLVFSKIDIDKAVDMSTGILVPNTPFIGGYAILPIVK